MSAFLRDDSSVSCRQSFVNFRQDADSVQDQPIETVRCFDRTTCERCVNVDHMRV